MVTLYHLPGSCSLATLTLLLELDQPVKLVHRNAVANYQQINPLRSVPALTTEQGKHLVEGGALVLHLLTQHDRRWHAMAAEQRQSLIQDILFANATVHPAYSRLFFLKGALPEGDAQQVAYTAAVSKINALWELVETRLQDQSYLGGDTPSPADIMLAVYSRWGSYFPLTIEIGQKGRQMIEGIMALSSFQRALDMEAELSDGSQ
jgi:glutathione S-transferase